MTGTSGAVGGSGESTATSTLSGDDESEVVEVDAAADGSDASAEGTPRSTVADMLTSATSAVNVRRRVCSVHCCA
jgi:hypothetical protein